jgi:pSer/pThr/pTyr-binding forkhead associated (FHA) protein
MAKLYLKFESSGQVLKELPLTQAATTIGRLPDNNLQIDNLAVSGHHAKISWEQGQYIVEDLGSLNGTYVNNERVGKATLKHGDQVKIGKHLVEFKAEGNAMLFNAPAAKAGPAAPKLEATMVLDTKKSREMIADKSAPAPGAGPLGISRPAWMSDPFVAAKDRVGLLSTLQGRTDQGKYVLTSKMTMIGKSKMASIRLKGFFAPTTAALISKRDNKYFISPSESRARVKINGEDVIGQRELAAGDVIEVGKVQLAFSFQE